MQAKFSEIRVPAKRPGKGMKCPRGQEAGKCRAAEQERRKVRCPQVRRQTAIIEMINTVLISKLQNDNAQRSREQLTVYDEW